jgi:hypothetical protein
MGTLAVAEKGTANSKEASNYTLKEDWHVARIFVFILYWRTVPGRSTGGK